MRLRKKFQSGEITTIIALGTMVFILLTTVASSLISKKPQTTTTLAASSCYGTYSACKTPCGSGTCTYNTSSGLYCCNATSVTKAPMPTQVKTCPAGFYKNCSSANCGSGYTCEKSTSLNVGCYYCKKIIPTATKTPATTCPGSYGTKYQYSNGKCYLLKGQSCPTIPGQCCDKEVASSFCNTAGGTPNCTAGSYMPPITNCEKYCGTGQCQACKLGTADKFECKASAGGNLTTCQKSYTYASKENCINGSGTGQKCTAQCTQCTTSEGAVRYECGGTGPIQCSGTDFSCGQTCCKSNQDCRSGTCVGKCGWVGSCTGSIKNVFKDFISGKYYLSSCTGTSYNTIDEACGLSTTTPKGTNTPKPTKGTDLAKGITPIVTISDTSHNLPSPIPSPTLIIGFYNCSEFGSLSYCPGIGMNCKFGFIENKAHCGSGERFCCIPNNQIIECPTGYNATCYWGACGSGTRIQDPKSSDGWLHCWNYFGGIGYSKGFCCSQTTQFSQDFTTSAQSATTQNTNETGLIISIPGIKQAFTTQL